MQKRKILIGSPVCQQPSILTVFLQSIKRLKIPDYEVFYYFFDDNENEISRHLLASFQKEVINATIMRTREDEIADPYINHTWNQKKIWKVAAYKDAIIEHARRLEFDYLFLVDSDLVLYPQTISHLISLGKDIVSEVFWTSWGDGTIAQPQVWMHDFYNQFEVSPGETLSGEEEARRTFEFFDMLTKPGVFEVGGLGGCTLISKSAVHKGVCFKRLKNISFWGEDRHFCVRAIALDIDLFVDTHYPAYHIYRVSQVQAGLDFLKNTQSGPVSEV